MTGSTLSIHRLLIKQPTQYVIKFCRNQTLITSDRNSKISQSINQPLFALTLAQNKKFSPIEILKVKIRVQVEPGSQLTSALNRNKIQLSKKTEAKMHTHTKKRTNNAISTL